MARAGQLVARIAGNAVHARLAYFRAKLRASHEPGVLLREADALFTFLARSSSSFHPCGVLIHNPIPMGVAFRYDIHARDIPGACLFAQLHSAKKIPATFFLFWDYSPIERSHFRDYRALRKLISEPAEIGLHDSPVDAFLMKTDFGGNRRAYSKWTDSADARKWLAELTSAPQKLAELNEATLEDFVSRVRQTRAHFGPFSLVAPHGSELWQNMRKKLESLEPAVAETARSLRARLWFTPERLTAAGLEVCLNQSDRAWREISDEGGKISKMAQLLGQRLRTEKSATQLLLHPYTWTGGERDAELSDLLTFESPLVAAAGSR